VKTDLLTVLREHGIQPSAQRVAVARHVLETREHPAADQVFEAVRRTFPTLSRATVYNTLHLFVEKGLLRELVLAPGKVVFDPKMEPHHHFIEESSGRIHDVPWEALRVTRTDTLPGFDVKEYQVVMRGRARAR
jgi:Fur family transcriptional regulator, iron response regulator